MTSATLLIELLTEELPPKALPKLGQAFADGIAAGLRTRGLAAADGAFRWFATPRRLAVSLAGVLPEAAAREVTEKIMPVSVALDAAGQPTAPASRGAASQWWRTRCASWPNARPRPPPRSSR